MWDPCSYDRGALSSVLASYGTSYHLTDIDSVYMRTRAVPTTELSKLPAWGVWQELRKFRQRIALGGMRLAWAVRADCAASRGKGGTSPYPRNASMFRETSLSSLIAARTCATTRFASLAPAYMAQDRREWIARTHARVLKQNSPPTHTLRRVLRCPLPACARTRTTSRASPCRTL